MLGRLGEKAKKRERILRSYFFGKGEENQEEKIVIQTRRKKTQPIRTKRQRKKRIRRKEGRDGYRERGFE